MNYNIRTLFPTTLCEYTFDEDLSPLLELVKQNTQQGNGHEVTNHRLLDELPEWKETILQPFRKFMKKTMHCNMDMAMSSSWGTRTDLGLECKLHYHSNSWYSGVLHFEDCDPKEGGQLMFYQMQPKTFAPDFEKGNQYNSRQWAYTPKKGKMVFFPSDLYHKIMPVKTDIARYSLAVNILPRGTYGDGDSTVTVEVL